MLLKWLKELFGTPKIGEVAPVEPLVQKAPQKKKQPVKKQAGQQPAQKQKSTPQITPAKKTKKQ